MSQLTKVRNLIRRPVRRSRIVRLTENVFGKNTLETKRIISALDVTTAMYRGERRKNGEARISHERQMFLIYMIHLAGDDPAIAVSILLHDLYEEKQRQWPLYRIEEEFGKEARLIVAAVSKPRMSDAELVSAKGSFRIFKKVKRGGLKAITVKIVDRSHFYAKPFPNQDRRRLVWKTAQTMKYFQPLALEVGVLSAELEELVGQCIRRNNITTEELSEFV